MASRLRELSDFTGLSESTISRVVNNRGKVAQVTRDAVMTAIDVLGYERPGHLSPQAVRLVAVVMPQFANPIFPAIGEAVAAHVMSRGFTPTFAVTEAGGPSEGDYVAAMLDRQVAGIVFVSGLHSVAGQDHDHYVNLIKRGMPVVAIDGVVAGLELACVSTDDAEAIELSLRHLTQLGHTHVGLAIADRDHVPGRRKEEAFLRRVEATPGLRGTVARSIYSLEGGMMAATELIVAGVTAVICASDVMALGAVRAARKLALNVPSDLSVIGFDDSVFMPLVDPPLTTIRQPVDAMAKAAANILHGQITGRGTPHGEILFEPELIVRASTGPSPTVRR